MPETEDVGQIVHVRVSGDSYLDNADDLEAKARQCGEAVQGVDWFNGAVSVRIRDADGTVHDFEFPEA